MAALIVECQAINRMLGTQLMPWELEQMPADWWMALRTWITALPAAREWKGEVEAAMAELRKKVRG